MLVLLNDLAEMPAGSHALALHDSAAEGAEHATAFLCSAPDPSSCSYWVDDPRLLELYRARVARSGPDRSGSVRLLPGSQVEPFGSRLRPVREVREFVGSHPKGVSVAAESTSRALNFESLPKFEEYERWLGRQPNRVSRYLCPYDLRRVPLDHAPSLMRALGEAHTHLLLSWTEDLVLRLLEVFLFATPNGVPEGLQGTLEQARDAGWLGYEAGRGFSWTVRGEHFAQMLREGRSSQAR